MNSSIVRITLINTIYRYCYIERCDLLISVSCDSECDVKVVIVVGELGRRQIHVGLSVCV